MIRLNGPRPSTARVEPGRSVPTTRTRPSASLISIQDSMSKLSTRSAAGTGTTAAAPIARVVPASAVGAGLGDPPRTGPARPEIAWTTGSAAASEETPRVERSADAGPAPGAADAAGAPAEAAEAVGEVGAAVSEAEAICDVAAGIADEDVESVLAGALVAGGTGFIELPLRKGASPRRPPSIGGADIPR